MTTIGHTANRIWLAPMLKTLDSTVQAFSQATSSGTGLVHKPRAIQIVVQWQIQNFPE